MSTHMMSQKHNSFPDHMDLPKAQYTSTEVPLIRRLWSWKAGILKKNGGWWTLKHEIRSQESYKLLIKTELRGVSAMDLKNIYNHIKMCINVVTRLRLDLLPAYQSIKRHSEFE